MMDLVIGAGEKQKVVLVHDIPESASRRIVLAGEGASVEVEEVFVSGGIASALRIEHAAKGTRSNVSSRGVVGKGEQVRAHAKVVIPKGMQGCDTRVVQKFLLLDESAKVDALPAFEIEESDVQASHAAAVAPLDEDAVFYLASRGMDESEARTLLVRGFLRVPSGFEHVVKKWQ